MTMAETPKGRGYNFPTPELLDQFKEALKKALVGTIDPSELGDTIFSGGHTHWVLVPTRHTEEVDNIAKQICPQVKIYS